ncbi:MAG: flagellar hook-associated protein FlgL [Nitrospiraceae bacterium]|nr:flagellar hook-associated protein FlgL [Nitrospirota bacterium]MDA8337743.1 flagellar hook-associated protein FlgL [Nitrospiraceae bacterium]
MRITTKMFYDRFLSDMQKNTESIFKSHEQISTGKKVNRPSDDPTAMSRIVNYKARLSTIGEYKRAIDTTRSYNESIDSAFSNLNELLVRVKELALQGADGATTGADRQMIVKEVAVQMEHAIDVANTKVGDRYIFSGYKSNIPPIDLNTGEFVSDASFATVDISFGVSMRINIPAGDLFSFKRVNPNDPSNSILPSYNWDRTGAYSSTDEIYEDADPNGALYTARFVVTASNNQIAGGTNGDTTAEFTATLNAGTYTGDQMAAEIKRALEAADGVGYAVTYNSTTQKFTITNNRGAARDLLWGVAGTTAERLLGFNPENTLTIANGSSDTGDSAVTGGGFTASTNTFSTSGGTLTIKVRDDDTTPVNVTISASSTLANVRDAINNANAGVKAEVVNIGTSANPDYRIVIASNPAGRPGDTRITATSDDAAGTGLHTLVYMSAADFITIDSANNTIRITEGVTSADATIAAGTYTADTLARAVKTALEGATASTNTYTIAYDSTNKKFKIISNTGNTDTLALLWSHANTTAETVLGFDAVDTTGIAATGSDTSDNQLTYSIQNQTLGTNITNYNYITDPSNANYYNFNNNYLNENNILRAFHFLKASLENNDTWRAEKAIDYINKVSEKLSQNMAEVGSRLNRIDSEENYLTDVEYNTTVYLSNDQDTDIAKAISEMTQRQTALEGLRTLSSDFLRASLFDFIK